MEKCYLAEVKGKIIKVGSLLELANFFDIQITNEGKVIFEGKQDTISYNMEEFTKKEVLKDFIRYRLTKLITIYKATKL